jgi:hypothetical protein
MSNPPPSQSPLSRLPPELSAQIYNYLIKPRFVSLNDLISGAKHYPQPNLFLVSKATRLDAKAHLFENGIFTIEVFGRALRCLSKEPCGTTRDTARDVIRRLNTLREVFLKARKLQLRFKAASRLAASSPVLLVVLEWYKLLLDQRETALPSLRLLFEGDMVYICYYCMPQGREGGTHDTRNLDLEGPLPFDCLLEKADEFRCQRLEAIEAHGCGRIISSTARQRLIEGYEQPRQLPSDEHCAGLSKSLAKKERKAVERVVKLYWRRAPLVARVTHGVSYEIKRVHRFGDEEDKIALAKRLDEKGSKRLVLLSKFYSLTIKQSAGRARW